MSGNVYTDTVLRAHGMARSADSHLFAARTALLTGQWSDALDALARAQSLAAAAGSLARDLAYAGVALPGADAALVDELANVGHAATEALDDRWQITPAGKEHLNDAAA